MSQRIRAQIEWADATQTEVQVSYARSGNILTMTTTTTTISALASAESPIGPPPPPPSSVTASETSITESVPVTPPPPHLRRPTTASPRSVTSTSTRSHRSSTRRSSGTPTQERPSTSSTHEPISNQSVGSARRAGIPHPADIVQPTRVNSRKFYVVFSGTRVGIFGDWYGQVVRYTKHIPDSHQKGFARFEDALTAYTAAYHGSGPRLQVLPEPEDRLVENLAGMSLSDSV